VFLHANGEDGLPKPSKVDLSKGCYADFPETEQSDQNDGSSTSYKQNDCSLPCPKHATCHEGVAQCFPDHLYNLIQPKEIDTAPHCELSEYGKEALNCFENALIALTKNRICGVQREKSEMVKRESPNQKNSKSSPGCKDSDETCPAIDLVHWFTMKELMQYLVFSGSLDDFGDFKEYEITVIFLSVHWKRNYDVQIENLNQIEHCIQGGFKGYECSRIKLGFTSDYAKTNIVGLTGCVSVWAFSKAFDLLTYFIKPKPL